MTDTEIITVRLAVRWTGPCKFCRRPVTFRKTIADDLLKFDADPVTLRAYIDTATGIPVEDVSAAELHAPQCPGIEHTLFDGIIKEEH